MSTGDIIIKRINHDPITVKELSDASGVGETAVREQLKRLEEEGVIEQAEPNGRSKTFRLISQKPQEDTETEPQATRSGDGRGRSEVARARDEHVLATLAASDGMTRHELTEASGVGDLTYMSLWRLHKAGRVKKVQSGTRAPIWKVA